MNMLAFTDSTLGSSRGSVFTYLSCSVLYRIRLKMACGEVRINLEIRQVTADGAPVSVHSTFLWARKASSLTSVLIAAGLGDKAGSLRDGVTAFSRGAEIQLLVSLASLLKALEIKQGAYLVNVKERFQSLAQETQEPLKRRLGYNDEVDPSLKRRRISARYSNIDTKLNKQYES